MGMLTKFLSVSMVILFVIIFTDKSLGNSGLIGSSIITVGSVHIPEEKPIIELIATLNSPQFVVDDDAELTIELVNTSKESIYLFSKFEWGTSSSFLYSIEDLDGNLMERKGLDDQLHPPPYSRDDFVPLKALDSIRFKRTIGIRSEGIVEPGKYRLRLFYQSPVFRKFAPKELKIWTREDGIVASEPIDFEVSS